LQTDPQLSLVIPVRDEVDSLEALHREIDAALAAPGIEILFVDDGSRDGSLERLEELAAKDPRVRVLALDGPRGQSAALAAGFRAARAPLTATLDADLQNDPADLPRLLAALDGADVVCGVRTPRADPWRRRAAARIGNSVRNLLMGEAVSDAGCALRVMRTAPLRRLRPFRGMHRYLPTLLALEGARVREIPVSHRPRLHGRSKVRGWARLRAGLLDVLGVRWLKSRQLRYGVREVEGRGRLRYPPGS
jgi:glycosyltransferase involved in cell wall biosynthesis